MFAHLTQLFDVPTEKLWMRQDFTEQAGDGEGMSGSAMEQVRLAPGMVDCFVER